MYYRTQSRAQSVREVRVIRTLRSFLTMVKSLGLLFGMLMQCPMAYLQTKIEGIRYSIAKFDMNL